MRRAFKIYIQRLIGKMKYNYADAMSYDIEIT